ncbi:TonB-dependent receptor [Nibricoccus aquaticus]|uniref:TonB-dependent receptor n=2 Tax=Nibricoccus aquaticus TaxID=2576891 RepID=A0A290Q6H1_9BACT|nr:TonB-dependent receptor [Nibricoccus aquaticus]
MFPCPVSSRQRALGRVAVLLCLLRAVSASAQTSMEEPQRLDPLVVYGRGTDLVGTARGASEGFVGAHELAVRPFLRRGELLEVVPGVVITQHSGGGKANQYFLRGFNLDHGTDFSVSVEGMPVNMRSHAHGQGYADLNFVIPELVESVGYQKGPFFAEVGDFSSAGAAEFRLVDELADGFLKLEAGENGYGRIVVADTLMENGGLRTLGLEMAQGDGPWEREENFRKWNVFARQLWKAGDRTFSVTALGYSGKWDSTDQIPLRAVEAGEIARFGFVDPSDGGESQRVSLSFDAEVTGADATTSVNVYAIYYRMNLFSNFSYALGDEENGDQFNQRDRRFVFGGEAKREWKSEIAGKRLEWSAGVQARYDAITELGLHLSSARERVGTVRDDDVNEASVGVFATGTLHVSEALRVNAGLRADGYRFDVESDNTLNSDDRTAGMVSPKFGVVFGPWKKTEVYANAGYSFHSNDARGTVIAVDPVSGDPAERVNPLVRSKGAEVGVRTSAVPGLVSTLSFWGLDLDSELVFVGDAGGTEPTGATRRYGVELANFYRAASWLTLDADLALTQARYRDAEIGAGGAKEDRIANSISRVVTAGASVEAPGGWFGALRVRYFGPQPLIEDNSVVAPSSTTWNGRVGWRSKSGSGGNEGWEVAVDVLNVFDRENYDIAYFYESRLRSEASGVATEDIHFHPAEPRTVRVSVTKRF